MLKLLRFLYSLRLFNNKLNKHDDDDVDKGKLLQGAPLDFYRRSKKTEIVYNRSLENFFKRPCG